MSHDDTITIHADILQITDAAVLIGCEGEETWLPLSQIDFYGERGDTDVPISLPEWLGDDKGLSDGDGMSRATVTDFHTGLPKNEDDGKNCRNCARRPLADNESGPMPGECQECTRSGLVGGTKDNWTDNGEEPDLPGDPPDTTRVTLTIISFSEDGETAQVEDRHGNQWELSTLDFLQDGDIDAGTTVLCYIQNSALAAEGCTLRPDEPEAQNSADEEDEGDVDTPLRPAEPAFLKTETITVSVPLDIEERESVGDRMASALEKISELEDDLDSYRKSINAEIKSLQKDAEKARKEWQEGKTEQEVYCDVMADYAAEAIIWLVHDTSKEMKRRPMTAEERQFRLPIPRPSDSAPVAASAHPDERPTAPVSMGTPKTCITCGSLADREGDDLPETCQTCAQANNGASDNWHPIRECRTCINSHTQVNMPPCAGCELNVEEAQRGDTDAWEWKDEEAADSAVRSDDAQELAQEEGGEEAQEELSGESEDEDSTVASAEEVAPGEGDTESDQTEEN